MSTYYESCGFLGFNKKPVDTSFFDSDTALFQNGKCVSTVDMKSDNAYVCGEGTAFQNGKCVSLTECDICLNNAKPTLHPGDTIESKNSRISCKLKTPQLKCGPGTINKDNTCVLKTPQLKCGPGTIVKDNTCVIDFGEKYEVKQSSSKMLTTKNPTHNVSKITQLNFEKSLEENSDFKIPYEIDIQTSFNSFIQ